MVPGVLGFQLKRHKAISLTEVDLLEDFSVFSAFLDVVLEHPYRAALLDVLVRKLQNIGHLCRQDSPTSAIYVSSTNLKKGK